jgi:hypothetical protein
MIRRYCLAIAGGLLVIALAVVVVDASPWTLSQFDGPFTSSVLGHAVWEKLTGALLLLVAWVLIRVMAFGERMGLIEPPSSDVTTLFNRDHPSREPSELRHELKRQPAGQPAKSEKCTLSDAPTRLAGHTTST